MSSRQILLHKVICTHLKVSALQLLECDIIFILIVKLNDSGYFHRSNAIDSHQNRNSSRRYITYDHFDLLRKSANIIRKIDIFLLWSKDYESEIICMKWRFPPYSRVAKSRRRHPSQDLFNTRNLLRSFQIWILFEWLWYSGYHVTVDKKILSLCSDLWSWRYRSKKEIFVFFPDTKLSRYDKKSFFWFYQ